MDEEWIQTLKFSEIDWKWAIWTHRCPKEHQGLPAKIRKNCHQTSVSKPRNAEIDEIS